jgi:hypothetical protein
MNSQANHSDMRILLIDGSMRIPTTVGMGMSTEPNRIEFSDLARLGSRLIEDIAHQSKLPD